MRAEEQADIRVAHFVEVVERLDENVGDTEHFVPVVHHANQVLTSDEDQPVKTV